MTKRMLCCGILQRELELLTGDMDLQLRFLDPALHVDLDLLETSLDDSLSDKSEQGTILAFGTRCHPDMEQISSRWNSSLIQSQNCVEMILGEKMAQFSAEAPTFFLTPGWLDNWRKIFMDGLKWDEIDARQNFGLYDRILLLDTGLTPIDDEKILEFFDYTQVLIDIIPVDLDHLRFVLGEVLKE